uniref:Uncharacterized protein n=1 Tax=viral metagenome TaxID=1070528 RepID=A0A6C0CV85_9ZZZZ
MLNTLVSLKSYVGTIIIFVLFIISFVVMVATMSVPNVKFLTIPLTISLGIALMNCVVYLNNIIQFKEQNVEETGAQQQFKTCPEYWRKSTMYTGEQGNYTPVNVCKNSYEHPEDDSKTRYVSGSTLSNSTFFDNFKSSYSNTSNIDHLLSEMNTVTGFTEDFTDADYQGTQIDTLDAESNGYIVRGDTENTGRKVLYVGASNYDGYSNNTLSNIPGSHYHFISSMTSHSNNTAFAEHADNNGAVFHWHGDEPDDRASLMLSGECESNWICKDTSSSDGGLIINLDKLNSFSNQELCKHGREFHWVEAMNKCDMVNY